MHRFTRTFMILCQYKGEWTLNFGNRQKMGPWRYADFMEGITTQLSGCLLCKYNIETSGSVLRQWNSGNIEKHCERHGRTYSWSEDWRVMQWYTYSTSRSNWHQLLELWVFIDQELGVSALFQWSHRFHIEWTCHLLQKRNESKVKELIDYIMLFLLYLTGLC